MKLNISCLVFALIALLSMLLLFSFDVNESNLNNDQNTQSASSPVVSTSGTWIDDGRRGNSFAGGDGSQNNPYQISNAAQLAYLSYMVYNGTTYEGNYFIQTSNIYLSMYYWTPIGTAVVGKEFRANYDGQGHTISGVFTKSDETYAGLFGRVKHSTISYVGIIDSNIQGVAPGSIVASVESRGEILYCYNSGNVTGDVWAGGVVGNIGDDSLVSNCYNTGAVSANFIAGGVVGLTNSNVSVNNCYNTGNVDASNNSSGGIVGTAQGGANISNCFNVGITSGSGNIGGIAGSIVSGYFTNCYFGGESSSDTNGTYLADIGTMLGNGELFSSYLTSWDMTNVWILNGTSYNGGCPLLRMFLGYQVDINIYSPSGVQDQASGTMTQTYGSKTHTGSDKGFSDIFSNDIWTISNITPAKGMVLERVYLERNRGSLSGSGYGPYTFTMIYNGSPNPDGDGYVDVIAIKMKWVSYITNYNLNGGSFADGESPTNNTQFNIALNIPNPSKTGYTFTGWNGGTNFNSSTAQSGSSSSVMSSWDGSLTKNTFFKNLTTSDGATVTLNANYSANSYTVTFNPNGQGGIVNPTTKSVTFDSTYGTLPTPTRTGYSFTGWTLNGTKITSTTQVKTASNHTVVAQWTANSYTVTFNPTGGTVSETTKSVTYDSTYGDLPIPTRVGYVFIGWYTDPNGGSQVLSTTKVQTANNHTIYAHWQDTWYSYATQPTGNGTSISPYIIDSAEDFAWIAKDIADNGTKSNYYKQTKLIDLSAHYWLPIGSDSNHSFNGLYDGQGFEIKNLKTYFPTNPDTPELQVNVGLFGYTAGSANIRGIVLRNATIKGAHNTGGIIGQATGKTIVKDIAVDNLNITTTMSYIGTIIGKSESTNVTIKNVVVYSATTSHNHRELDSGEATIDSCLVSIQESKKYHDNTGDGFDFTQWVYISGLKMPVPKGLSWLANGGEPLTKEVLESLGFSAYQY